MHAEDSPIKRVKQHTPGSERTMRWREKNKPKYRAYMKAYMKAKRKKERMERERKESEGDT